MTDFTIERLQIGCGNPGYNGQRMFVSTYVTIGPIRFEAHLDAQGEPSLPHTLQDRSVRQAITARMRTMTIAEITEKWNRRNEADAVRLAKSEAA